MPAKPPSTHNKRTPAVLIVLIVFVVLSVGGLFGWTIYHGHEVDADKARFAQAERDIDELSKAVVATVGTPAKTSSEKYCSRPSVKMGDAPLSCDINATLHYGIENVDGGSTILDGVSKIVSPRWGKPMDSFSSNSGVENDFANIEEEYQKNTSFQQKNKKYDLSDGMTCNVSHQLYKSSEPPFGNVGIELSPLTLVVGLSCGDYAKIEHYPEKS